MTSSWCIYQPVGNSWIIVLVKPEVDSDPCLTYNMEFFAEIVYIWKRLTVFCKKLHLTCSTEFWIHLIKLSALLDLVGAVIKIMTECFSILKLAYSKAFLCIFLVRISIHFQTMFLWHSLMRKSWNTIKCEDLYRKTLRPMTPYGLNIQNYNNLFNLFYI